MRYLALCALLLAPPALAGDKDCRASGVGTGSVTTCEQWFDARRNDRQRLHAYLEWASGFLTARALYGPGRGQPFEPNSLVVLIDEHCNNPNIKYLNSAVVNLSVQVIGPYRPVCKDRD